MTEKKSIKERADEIIMGHCDIFGNIPNGTNKDLIIIALVKDRKDDIIDALFYEEDRFGDKYYGVAKDVIVWEGKVCWNGGSANHMNAVEGYRHFQYCLDRSARLLWHSGEWSRLLDEVAPRLMVSQTQVTHAMFDWHTDQIDACEIAQDSDISVLSFDLFLSYGLQKVLNFTTDGDMDIDQAFYTYRMTDLEDDLKMAIKRAQEIYE